jgi:putative phage-type endonuclease
MRILTAEERRQGLGATDVAAIVGVGYRTPIDVWLEKTGQAPPDEPSWRMRMGQLLEPSIAAAYSEQTGRKLRRRGVVFDRTVPYFYCHPDREIVGEPGLLEIKATSHARDYDEGVPPRVRVQAAWQMSLTGKAFVDVAVLASTTSGFLPITVERDDVLIDELRAEADRFWRENVQASVPPEVDGTEAYRRYLASRYPTASGAEIVATPEVALQLAELRRRELALKAVEADVELLKNRIREAMGPASRLLASIATVTLNEESPRTPWKLIAEQFAAQYDADLEAIAEAAKANLPRPRTLRFTWKGEPLG